jgi:hypothetical protein
MDLSKPSTTMTPGVLVMPIEVCCAVILEQFSQSFIASSFKLTVDYEVMTALIVVLPLIVVVEISLQLHRSFSSGFSGCSASK